jgi:hypothetical protein
VSESHVDIDVLADLDAGLLDAARTEDVRAHLVACPTCAEQLRQLQDVRAALASLRDIAMPDDVLDRITASLAPPAAVIPISRRRHRARSTFLVAVSSAAAIVVGVFLGHLTSAPTGQPTSTDLAVAGSGSVLAPVTTPGSGVGPTLATATAVPGGVSAPQGTAQPSSNPAPVNPQTTAIPTANPASTSAAMAASSGSSSGTGRGASASPGASLSPGAPLTSADLEQVAKVLLAKPAAVDACPAFTVPAGSTSARSEPLPADGVNTSLVVYRLGNTAVADVVAGNCATGPTTVVDAVRFSVA